MRLLTIGFLPRNATDCRLRLWSSKAHLWSTTSWKNQPGPSGNGLQQRSSLWAPTGYTFLQQGTMVRDQNQFELSDLGYFRRRTRWSYSDIPISKSMSRKSEEIPVWVANMRQWNVWSVTFDKDVIETCGLRCSTEKRELHRPPSKSDWSTVEQSGHSCQVIISTRLRERFLRIPTWGRTIRCRKCFLRVIETIVTLLAGFISELQLIFDIFGFRHLSPK